MKKIKKFSKYAVNILAIFNALLVGLDPIWDIPLVDKIVPSISVIIAVFSTYLLGNKAISTSKIEGESYDNQETIINQE